MHLRQFLDDLSRFPWKTTALTLRARFRDDHLGLTASSLTFTTTIALVPFFTVALAVFTAFPIFGKLQDVLQRWLIDSLIPDSIARQVLGYLTQFASKANRLGAVGLALLVVTATALILTIDRTLNSIWRVRRPRLLGHRVLIYWAAITLGPLLLAASLATTSYVVSAGQGLVGALPGGLRLLLNTLEFISLAGGMAALYRYVPNTPVKWGHAWAGGVFVAAGIEAGKRLLALYLASIPTYSMVYGAFAIVPILLIWIYVAWVIVLLGAVVAAYLPSLLSGVARHSGGHGWHFQLAVEVLQHLDRVTGSHTKGLSAAQLARVMRVDALQLQPVMETLSQLDWVGLLAENTGRADAEEARYVLLANPDTTPLEPLARQLLLEPSTSMARVYQNAGLSSLKLREVL
jgi:membrane protein